MQKNIFGITDGESRITGLIDSVDACEYLFSQWIQHDTWKP